MKVVTTVTSPIEPKFIEALGCEGYTHYEVASSLCARPTHVVDRIKSLMDAGVINPIITVGAAITGAGARGRTVTYNLTIGDAKVVAAKYDNEH
jgi:hypothetical protein